MIILSSCPSPLDPAKLDVLQDLNAPVISITSPAQDSLYRSSVTISGIILDVDFEGNNRSIDTGSFIKTASYFILNHDTESTPIQVADDGSFSFTVETSEYATQISIIISAEDLNGNTVNLTITLNPNAEGPYLLITSPSNYSEYATLIELEGYAVNSTEDDSTSELNTEVSYNIPGTSISGTTTLDTANGYFSKTIDVSAIDGSKTIVVTASDLNSNETSVVVNIIKPSDGGDISGFTVTPANKQVTISWDPVPGAQSYSILESRYGQIIEGDAISGNSYTWTGLTNGEKYTFQLTANMPAILSGDAVSAEVTTMPLSVRSLTPWVKEIGYKSISIDWRDIPNVDNYMVERSISPDDPWEIRRNLTESTFTDSMLDYDISYYYRVTPSEFRDVVSDYAEGVPGRFAYETIAICDTPDRAGDIVIKGSYAYVADEESGLQILDISNPESPHIIGSCDTPGSAKRVDVEGDYAYIAGGNAGLHIISISDPTIPEIKYTWNTDPSTGATSVAVEDNCAYVTNSYGSIRIINISNPESPSLASSRDLPSSGTDITVVANYIYVVEPNSGLYIFDSSAPLSPSLAGNRNTPESSHGIAVAGDSAYMADERGGLQIINILDPSAPVIIGNCISYGDEMVDLGSAYGVAVADNYAYVADYGNGLQIIDITDPTSPQIIANCETTGSISGVAIGGNYAYTVGHSSDFQICDVTDPYYPKMLGSVDTDYAKGVIVVGNYAYVADSSSGMKIIDVSDSESPSITGTYDTSGSAAGVTVAGNYAYVADTSSGLQIIDISTPAAPFLTGSCDTPGSAYGVAVSGKYAIIADGSSGLEVINITDPSSPEIVGSYNTSGSSSVVTLAGRYAYIADGDSGLQIIDLLGGE